MTDVQTPRVAFVVRYLGGFAGFKASRGGPLASPWLLELTGERLSVKRFSGAEWLVVREEPWSSVGAVDVASSNRTRANLAAIASFGVLGLAARKEAGTLIAVAFTDGAVGFSTADPAVQLRAALVRFCEQAPIACPKVRFDGLSVVTPEDSNTSLVQELRELGELLQLGVLTQDEFEAAKRKLLS